MAASRRIFLEIFGVGAASTTLDLACIGTIDDPGGSSAAAGGSKTARSEGSTGGSSPGGTGGAEGGKPIGGGTGGVSGTASTTGGSGTGGEGRATGGAGIGGSGVGGRAGAAADGGVPDRDASVDALDAGGPPRDAATTILGPGDITAGNVSNLTVGALNAIPGRTVAVGRDAIGVYALTLVCTHAGCTAAPASNNGVRQINCPCHGSQFDRNGAVIQGPATRALVHFSVEIDVAGNIIVHTRTQVGATVRVAP